MAKKEKQPKTKAGEEDQGCGGRDSCGTGAVEEAVFDAAPEGRSEACWRNPRTTRQARADEARRHKRVLEATRGQEEANL